MGHPYPARTFAPPPLKKMPSTLSQRPTSLVTTTTTTTTTNPTSPLGIAIPLPRLLEADTELESVSEKDTDNNRALSSSLPSATLPSGSPSLNRRSHLERQRSKFDLLFNGTVTSPTLPSLYHESEVTSPSSGFSTTTPIPDSHPLLQSCYATIGNLRVEVDRWQTRCQEAQGRAQASDEASFSVIAERNVLQQRLLEADQENNTLKSRVTSLNGEVDTLDIEIDKLRRENHRLRKMAYRQEESDHRISELETLLTESQRQFNQVDTKFHRLQSQYDTLKKAHRKLQQSSQRGGTDAEVFEKIAWLKESNDKLRNALGEVVTMTAGPNTIQQQATTLVGVVNQLIDANGRLKSEMLGYCDLISEYKAENQHMRNQVRSLSPHSDASTPSSPNPSIRPRLRRRSSTTRPCTMPDTTFLNHPTLLDELSQLETPRQTLKQSRSTILTSVKTDMIKEANEKRFSGVFTTSVPMHHLYQDNWMSCTDESEVEEPLSRRLTPVPGSHRRNLSVTSTLLCETEVHPRPENPVSKELEMKRNHRLSVPVFPRETLPGSFPSSRHSLVAPLPAMPSPLPVATLVEVTEGLLMRLQASDPKCLNRKLQRSFDLLRLAPISNEVISNIQQNIALLTTRFAYLKTESPTPSVKLSHQRSRSQPINLTTGPLPPSKLSGQESSQQGQFLALVDLVEKLLSEVAESRTNFNHLSMAYVEKMATLAEDQVTSPKLPPWPQLLSLRKPSSVSHLTLPSEVGTPVPRIPPSRQSRHRRAISQPDAIVQLSKAPMQVRNGVVNYTPQQAVSFLPVVSCPSPILEEPSLPSSPSAATLRRLLPLPARPRTNLSTTTRPPSYPAPASVHLDNTDAPRAAVICHPYKLTRPHSEL